jgi:hypothetical protein
MKRNTNLLFTGFTLALLITTQGCTTAGKAATSEHSAPMASTLSGKIVETMDGGGYTYICLERDGKKTWAAVPVMSVSVGQNIALQPGAEMTDFTSKALNRTFTSIMFSSGVAQGASAQPAAHAENKAAAASQGGPVLAGKVVETMNAAGYTYVQLEKNGKKGWAAVPTTKVKVGDEIELIPGVEMGKFTSSTLKRTFDNIHFSAGLKGAGSAAASKQPLPEGHPSLQQSGTQKTEPAAAKAEPATASKAAAKAAPVPIKGKVVETMDAAGYSYVCLENAGQKIWLAVPATKVVVGEERAFLPGAVMPKFTSKSLNRTFDKIIFSSGPAAK